MASKDGEYLYIEPDLGIPDICHYMYFDIVTWSLYDEIFPILIELALESSIKWKAEYRCCESSKMK
jgi:hypothetical protein